MFSMQVKEAVWAILLADIVLKPRDSLLVFSHDLSSLAAYPIYRIG